MTAISILQNVLAIAATIYLSYLGGVFFFVGKRNVSYIKELVEARNELNFILRYSYVVMRALVGIIAYLLMIIALLIGIYVQEHYITIHGIATILLTLFYVMFFAAGNMDATRVLKRFDKFFL
jgi:hypothetical protein